MQHTPPDFFSKQTLTPLHYLTTIRHKRIYIKRDDLNHPTIQGNKLRKLKYNLLAAHQNQQTLISFGGAYSNHIAALAAAGKLFQLPTIGIIRGEELGNHANKQHWGHTLQSAHDNGMTLHFVSRSTYRDKEKHADIARIIQGDPNAYLIPEGGSNTLAVKGCSEMMSELNEQLEQVDCLFAACGTGGTFSGLIDGAFEQGMNCTLHAIAVLKGAHFLHADIKRLSQHSQQIPWQVHHDYHFGGYAKHTTELLQFMQTFNQDYTTPLDPVYTSKLAYAVFDLAKNSDTNAANWVIYHSGGLQGNKQLNSIKTAN